MTNNRMVVGMAGLEPATSRSGVRSNQLSYMPIRLRLFNVAWVSISYKSKTFVFLIATWVGQTIRVRAVNVTISIVVKAVIAVLHSSHPQHNLSHRNRPLHLHHCQQYHHICFNTLDQMHSGSSQSIIHHHHCQRYHHRLQEKDMWSPSCNRYRHSR